MEPPLPVETWIQGPSKVAGKTLSKLLGGKSSPCCMKWVRKNFKKGARAIPRQLPPSVTWQSQDEEAQLCVQVASAQEELELQSQDLILH